MVGGRDRQAGGTWCASDVGSGVTAVVLNQPGGRAEPGAPSRGTLPLLAVADPDGWAQAIEPAGMAGFHLVLAGPGRLRWWSFDGQRLAAAELGPGTHLFTPRGLADDTELAGRFAAARHAGPVEPAGSDLSPDQTADQAWPEWLDTIRHSEPSDDPLDLLVRIERGPQVFRTVFGQFIAARPGRLRLDHTREPAENGPWVRSLWQLRDGAAEPG